MSTPRLMVAVALMSVSACAARQHTGFVGQGTAFVQPRDAAASHDPGAAHPPWAVVPTMAVTYHPGRAARQLAAEHAAAEAQLQREAEARMQMELATQRQAEIDAHRELLIVDVEQRRLDIAQRARDDLRRRWLAWGAIPRPPMPALLAEEPGEPPYPGAVWTPGRWEWVNARWTWRAGYWSKPDVFDDAGGDLTVGVGVGFDFDLGGGETSRIRDHRTGPRIRDHRDGKSDFGSEIRDHRDGRSSSKPEPTVRDHRNNSREEMPKSTIRDHRDDKADDKDDRQGTVRDHRRR